MIWVAFNQGWDAKFPRTEKSNPFVLQTQKKNQGEVYRVVSRSIAQFHFVIFLFVSLFHHL